MTIPIYISHEAQIKVKKQKNKWQDSRSLKFKELDGEEGDILLLRNPQQAQVELTIAGEVKTSHSQMPTLLSLQATT